MWYIYRIFSTEGPLQYYGSTNDVRRRWLEHKSDFRCGKLCTSKLLFAEYGIEN
jgi:predicted GIY-YIG superfamily endonuclease